MVRIAFDNDDVSILVPIGQFAEGCAMRRLGVHEHQPIEFWLDIDGNLSRSSTLLNSLCRWSVEKIAFAGFNADRARACAGEGVDVPKLPKAGP
jgi:hypothetical protein